TRRGARAPRSSLPGTVRAGVGLADVLLQRRRRAGLHALRHQPSTGGRRAAPAVGKGLARGPPTAGCRERKLLREGVSGDWSGARGAAAAGARGCAAPLLQAAAKLAASYWSLFRLYREP